jgi:hypothetical protein
MPDRIWTVTRTWSRVHADTAADAVESTMGRLHDSVNAREGDFSTLPGDLVQLAPGVTELLTEVAQLREEVNALREVVNRK